MELSRWTTTRAGITLVSVVVTNPHDEPVRFRLANELDGPVWPPRTNGRIEAGWDADGYEGVLDPGERVSIGYATPAPEESPAAVIERVERVEGSDPRSDNGREGRSPPQPGGEQAAGSGPLSGFERALRSFQDPRPPRDVLLPGPAVSKDREGDWETLRAVTATEPGGSP